ncbi:hypothetical protein PhCBS80983_g03005 [Powellomyces hirtus]|uniref:CHCH domain-containing protein n=1 Tax=Powellomyces hirtus TaxID=109895 RepID=A0A507E474_9FUNG|nr:hypothetical protein PhCBS80983_g03005 [Powellomyces hirtus]
MSLSPVMSLPPQKADPTVVCDSRELQECLQKNNGDRSKCLKEWEDFKKACMEKK